MASRGEAASGGGRDSWRRSAFPSGRGLCAAETLIAGLGGAAPWTQRLHLVGSCSCRPSWAVSPSPARPPGNPLWPHPHAFHHETHGDVDGAQSLAQEARLA